MFRPFFCSPKVCSSKIFNRRASEGNSKCFIYEQSLQVKNTTLMSDYLWLPLVWNTIFFLLVRGFQKSLSFFLLNVRNTDSNIHRHICLNAMLTFCITMKLSSLWNFKSAYIITTDYFPDLEYRIKFYSQEIVIFRRDLLYRMRRSCLIPPSTAETSDPFAHVSLYISWLRYFICHYLLLCLNDCWVFFCSWLLPLSTKVISALFL